MVKQRFLRYDTKSTIYRRTDRLDVIRISNSGSLKMMKKMNKENICPSPDGESAGRLHGEVSVLRRQPNLRNSEKI